MTRAFRLNATDIQRLTRPRRGLFGSSPRPGVLVFFKFLQGEGDETKKWQPKDVADLLKALINPEEPRTMEIWIRRESIQIGFWCPNRLAADQLENQVKTFNPSAVEYRPAMPFPTTKPGCIIRVGRAQLRRNPVSPIETSFGMRAEEGRNSPIVVFLNNLPLPPDGSTLLVQLVWKKHWYNWQRNPVTRWEFPARALDLEGAQEKAKAKHTYYLDARIAEIHQTKDAAKDNYCRAIGAGFAIWNKEQGNGFIYNDKPGWGRGTALEFLRAMQERDWKRFRYPIWSPRRPHLTKDELACIIHVPPQGAAVSRIVTTTQKSLKATAAQRAEYEAIRAGMGRKAAPIEPTDPIPGTIQGRPRKMTASDLNLILDRAGVR